MDEDDLMLVEAIEHYSHDAGYAASGLENVARRIADQLAAKEEANERLVMLLKMLWKREVPELGTPDWHFLMSIVEPDAALGETK